MEGIKYSKCNYLRQKCRALKVKQNVKKRKFLHFKYLAITKYEKECLHQNGNNQNNNRLDFN